MKKIIFSLLVLILISCEGKQFNIENKIIGKWIIEDLQYEIETTDPEATELLKIGFEKFDPNNGYFFKEDGLFNLIYDNEIHRNGGEYIIDGNKIKMCGYTEDSDGNQYLPYDCNEKEGYVFKVKNNRLYIYSDYTNIYAPYSPESNKIFIMLGWLPKDFDLNFRFLKVKSTIINKKEN